MRQGTSEAIVRRVAGYYDGTEILYRMLRA